MMYSSFYRQQEEWSREEINGYNRLRYFGYNANRRKSFIPNYEVAMAFELALQTGSWSLSWVSGKDSLSWKQL